MQIHQTDPAFIAHRFGYRSWEEIMQVVAHRRSVRQGIAEERKAFGRMQDEAEESWDS